MENGTSNGGDDVATYGKTGKTYLGGVGGKRKYRRHPKVHGVQAFIDKTLIYTRKNTAG